MRGASADRTILITGANDGIGHALVVQYAAAGARVLGVGRRAFPPSLAGHMAPQDYCALDLGDSAAAATICAFLAEQQVTHLDILVHNAAIGWFGAPAQQSSTSIDALLHVNLYAPIALTHALLPRLRTAHGAIAFVSSVHSALPTPDFAVYTATKAGLDGFARSLRIEEDGAIDVLVLWPGPTRTQLHSKSGVPPQRARAERYPTPETVASAAIRVIAQRRSRSIGLGNRLLRWAAVHWETPIDAILARAGGRLRRGEPA